MWRGQGPLAGCIFVSGVLLILSLMVSVSSGQGIQGQGIHAPEHDAEAPAQEPPAAPADPAMDASHDGALRQLHARYPRARFQRHETILAVSGVPMTSGDDPEEAVHAWIAAHGSVIHVRASELVLQYANAVRYGQFTVFAYRQRIMGMPVEDARVRILVREDEPCRVVHAAAADMATLPADGFPAIRVPAVRARRSVQVRAGYGDLDVWTDPTLAILPPAQLGGDSTRVWKFGGYRSDRVPRAFTFFVDAATGVLLRVRSEIAHETVSGVVKGMATPGNSAPSSSNDPEEVVMEGVFVELDGGDEYSDEDGEFSRGGFDDGESVTVDAVLEGDWVEVFTDQGSEHEVTETVEAPDDDVEILFNEDEEEFDLAQVDAFIHTMGTHDWFRDRAPDFDEIDTQLTANTNLDQSCNAFFTSFGPSINFFNAAGGCRNTAYSSVVAHEYGHYIVWELGLAQGAFGEGFSDVCSMLQFDDGIVGRGFFNSGGAIRNNDTTGRSYPCTGAVHFCGMLLASTWWDIRENFEDADDIDDALEAAAQLFVDWAQITVGGSGSNSAHPVTVTEILELDDDDGDLDTGTPHYSELCDAFDDHGLECPEVIPLVLEFPEGVPQYFSLDDGTSFEVKIVAIGKDYEADTVRLHVADEDGDFDSYVLDPGDDPDVFVAELDTDLCAADVQFYVSVEDDDGTLFTAPENAPDETFSGLVAETVEVMFFDDFESDADWEVGDDVDADDATAGVWERTEPVRTLAQPEFDVSSGDGNTCFITEAGTASQVPSLHDVDEGKTTLTSPSLDLGTAGEYFISYWRWFSNDRGADPDDDTFRVEVSREDGAEDSWVEVETLGPFGGDRDGGWIFQRVQLSDYVARSDEVRLRFVVKDVDAPALVEAALDDVRVLRVFCEGMPVGPTFERGNLDGREGVTLFDAFEFLDYVFMNLDPLTNCDSAYDIDDDGDLGVGDAIGILQYLFQNGDAPASPSVSCGEDPTEDDLTCEDHPGCS